MFWFISLIVFCISLIFFFYLRKGKKQALPDYSYIIFKDYSSDYNKPMIARDAKADKGVQAVILEEEKKEEINQMQETPIATLNFED